MSLSLPNPSGLIDSSVLLPNPVSAKVDNEGWTVLSAKKVEPADIFDDIYENSAELLIQKYESLVLSAAAGVASSKEDSIGFSVAPEKASESPIFLRNEAQETPLSVAIRSKCPESVKALLKLGASSSVFVKGFSPGSLMCTLPMARQPANSVFHYPEPLETVDPAILAMVDEAVAEHIAALATVEKEREKVKAAEAAAELARQKSASAAPAPASTVSKFNHYPSTLSKGDIVRRGPDWRWGDQDMLAGTEHAGIVSGPSSTGWWNVDWFSDVKDPSTKFGSNSYEYVPTPNSSKCGLFVVDPSDHKAVPSNMTAAAASQVKVPPANKFRAGDLVRLVDGCEGSSPIMKASSITQEMREASKSCLGRADEGRLGVIVKVTKEEYTKTRTPNARQFTSGEPDPVVLVMDLENAKLCKYASSDLKYADGSKPGPVSLPVQAISDGKPKALKSKKSKTFDVGDKVQLCANPSDHRGCLGSPSYKWVGVVKSVGSEITVYCVSARGGSYPTLSGNYPNHDYSPSDLVHEHQQEQSPLTPGERVWIAPTFDKHSKDGWCLGAVGSKKTGVVMYQSVRSEPGKEQRGLLVAAVDEPTKLYSYRSSWLQRAVNDGTQEFKIGDRVQLDPTKVDTEELDYITGKCLGTAASYGYGIVTSAGSKRDGIQRNIEVAAVSGPSHGRMSLYPGYALVPAFRATVLTSTDKDLLISVLEDLIAKFGHSGLDLSSMVAKHGLAVWNNLHTIVTDEALHESWTAWSALRAPDWDVLAEAEVELKFPHSLSSDLKEGGKTLWTCAGCKMDKNTSDNSKCVVCKTKATQWTCQGCSGLSYTFEVACVACKMTRVQSNERKAEIEGRKREAEAAKKRAKEEAESAGKVNNVLPGEIDEPAILTQTEDAVADGVESDVPPDGRIRHPGSLTGCGGNPDGVSNCMGSGNCGPDCFDCGVRSHWTCCSSDAKTSEFCLPTITAEDAKKNADLMLLPRSTPISIREIPGFVSAVPEPTEWFCPSCTFANPMERSKCEMCETENPSPPRQKKAAATKAAESGTASASNSKTAPEKFEGKITEHLSRYALASMLDRVGEGLTEEEMKNKLSQRSKAIYSAVILSKHHECELVVAPGNRKNRASCDVCSSSKSIEYCCLVHGWDICGKCFSKEKTGTKDGAEDDSEKGGAEAEAEAATELVEGDNDSEQEVADSDVASDDDENDDANNGISSSQPENEDVTLDEDLELKKNSQLEEASFFGDAATVAAPSDSGSLAPVPLAPTKSLTRSSSLPGRIPLTRQPSVLLSTAFIKMGHYEPLSTIEALRQSVDKNGNSAAHHAAAMHMKRTAEALFTIGISRWQQNTTHDTPIGLLSGLPANCGERQNRLFKAISKHDLLPSELVLAALDTPEHYFLPPDAVAILEAIREVREDDADDLTKAAVASDMPHAALYRAVFKLEFDFGQRVAHKDLSLYIDEMKRLGAKEVNPLYYYAKYLLWKRVPSSKQPSHAKAERLRAADALTAFKCFPLLAEKWLDPARDSVDKQVEDAGLDEDVPTAAAEEEDYSDLFPPPGPNDPEVIWERAKADYQLTSKSMDELMALTGMKEVKKRAVSVVLSVLLDTPADVKNATSMNFLFVGNPGSGKTTVATLLAQAMVEVGFRKNAQPVFTSADEILGAQNPAQEFADQVKQSDGGTLFIDEAYLFDPAPKGQRGNDSNKVLNVLIKATDAMRHSTSFILAGYEEEIQTLMQSNPGFPSRFPKEFTFIFNDYSEIQLTKILDDMAKKRGLRFESKRECGVPIARVLARRIHRGANKKGFGNARLCEKLLEQCILNQKERLIKLKVNKAVLTPADYRVLTRGDTIGDRPNLRDSESFRELNAMIGLHEVKKAVENLMNLQLRNYDLEMAGDPIQQISLHRLFFGNPGTGKTTVAKLYGRMLKEFGFLSDGSFIMVTPSDLKGAAVGEAAARTKSLLDGAKGKVVFIDEAYNLDPARHSGSYGAEVVDTIVEKIDGAVGSDICVIMAGYKPQMEQLIRNCKNPGLKRRFNKDQAFNFEDFDDADLKKVLKAQVVHAELEIESSTLDFAVREISKKRIEEGFGNAGECEQILGRAKQKLSTRVSKGGVPYAQSKLLLEEDFQGEETSLEKARDAFSNLEFVDDLLDVMYEFEASVEAAKSEGRNPQEVLENMHMVFYGPPGTGKTTCAKRFGVMFKNLELLPRADVEYTTASQLIDRYVGGTSNNTLEVMRRAKGGVLFIDEAYGMIPSKGNSFGRDIIQALLDNITTDEFKGKLVVILGGYLADIEDIFTVNPGFQSRFDKKRVEFREWTSEQATTAVVNAIARDGKSITEMAKQLMSEYFEALVAMPNWASARDALELVYKNMEIKRASRAAEIAKQKRLLQGSGAATSGNSTKYGRRGKPADGFVPIPFEDEDVIKVFSEIIKSRGGFKKDRDAIRRVGNRSAYADLINQSSREDKLVVVCFTAPSWCGPCQHFQPIFKTCAERNSDVIFATVDDETGREVIERENVNSFPTTKIYLRGSHVDTVSGADEDSLKEKVRHFAAQAKRERAQRNAAESYNTPSQANAPPAPTPAQHNIRHNVNHRRMDDEPDEGEDKDLDEAGVWAALEEACKKLGMSLADIKDMLEDEAGFPPQNIVDLIVASTGFKNIPKIRDMLGRQRVATLEKVKHSIRESERAKTEEETEIQAALACIGRCPMGFEWIREDQGWRCAGGSHYCTHEEIQAYMDYC